MRALQNSFALLGAEALRLAQSGAAQRERHVVLDIHCNTSNSARDSARAPRASSTVATCQAVRLDKWDASRLAFEAARRRRRPGRRIGRNDGASAAHGGSHGRACYQIGRCLAGVVVWIGGRAQTGAPNLFLKTEWGPQFFLNFG